jgi:hypothetical protein
MPYLAILATLIVLGTPLGGSQVAAASATAAGNARLQFAYDDEYGRESGGDLNDDDQDDNDGPGLDDGYDDDNQGDSAHGAPGDDDDDDGDDQDDGLSA